MTRFRCVFTHILILLLTYQISPLYADNAVPVLLWGGSVNSDLATSAVNPFLKTTSKEFESFLHKKLDNLPPVLLYVKDNLCVEDLVKHKEPLQKIVPSDSLHYFPAVEEAVNTLEDLSSYNQTYNDYVDSVSDGQLLIMPISNLDVIPETYKTIKESSPNLIAVLTGKSCSYRRFERVKRADTDDKEKLQNFTVTMDRVLMYASRPLMIKEQDGTMPIDLPTKYTPTEKSCNESLCLTLTFNGTDKPVKYQLTFIFEVKTAGYYTLKTVDYASYTSLNSTGNQQNLIADTDIVFPFNFSYHCSQNTTFFSNTTSLIITNLQVQLDVPLKNNTKTFDDAYDCVGFTTIPIWTGIFVTAILAMIMIWALTMIIDIRTMDRFDDPKGKTITISAQE
ncbi:uncharacterized protein LOC100880959 [Megachile rotundata]|uniref:uncharacterized protein LOC100880959 n=1 Tax=Megachile rotundata TaxID=143995 RepID=UPI000258F7F7|nr:PREDICTED: uncharacterized protein LOC100880959 [Megachile rotundata]